MSAFSTKNYAIPGRALKKLLSSLGVKPASTKGENLKLLDSCLVNGNGQGSGSSNGADPAMEVEAAHSRYEAIKADLRSLTLEEMRARFAAISRFPKPALAGLLSRLGYSADGGKEEMERKLLDNLTSIKISYDQTKQIGG